MTKKKEEKKSRTHSLTLIKLLQHRISNPPTLTLRYK